MFLGPRIQAGEDRPGQAREKNNRCLSKISKYHRNFLCPAGFFLARPILYLEREWNNGERRGGLQKENLGKKYFLCGGKHRAPGGEPGGQGIRRPEGGAPTPGGNGGHWGGGGVGGGGERGGPPGRFLGEGKRGFFPEDLGWWGGGGGGKNNAGFVVDKRWRDRPPGLMFGTGREKRGGGKWFLV